MPPVWLQVPHIQQTHEGMYAIVANRERQTDFLDN